MKQLPYSELFLSLQGEGPRVGTPSIFLRVWGCNLECPAFGQSYKNRSYEELMSNQEQEIQFFDQKYSNANDISEIPTPKIGCDSSPSWSKHFSRFIKHGTVQEIIDEFRSLLPNGVFGNEYDLILTGGEPLMPKYQQFYKELLKEAQEQLELRNITFETNATYPIENKLEKGDFVDVLNYVGSKGSITWVCSPKMTSAGYNNDGKVNAEAIESYDKVFPSYLYLKYVTDTESDFPEIQRHSKYISSSTNIDGFDGIYVMPEGAVADNEIERKIAEACIRNGFRYSPRLQNNLWNNSFGT